MTDGDRTMMIGDTVFYLPPLPPEFDPAPEPPSSATDPSIAESIRLCGGWLMTVGYFVKDGEPCPCCGEPQRTWKNQWGGTSSGTMGMFRHHGHMIWVCQKCWDEHTPAECK